MLSDDLARWFDDELWRVAGGSSGHRFASAVTPEELISQAPRAIWPALMPCDFLPLLTNEMGDWLCVRIAPDNSASQIVHWYHGGGDWIPWGNSIAEAIFFDLVRHHLPGSERDHAIAAHSAAEADDRSCHPINDWAIAQLSRIAAVDINPLVGDELIGDELAAAMIQAQISEAAVRCQQIIHALDNPLLSEPLIRSWQAGDADRVQQALFDNQRLPDEWLERATEKGDSPEQILAQQDWDAVQDHCRRVTEIEPELAWGWDLLGYTYERVGDRTTAIQNYRRGLDCSVFTDQTVRVRTHGFNGEGQKFAAARLLDLRYQPVGEEEQDYFRCLSAPSPDQRRDRVREHFSRLAEKAEPAEAHDLWQRAGWDLGAEPMLAFAELLEHIAQSAQAAGRTGQSELAKTHRNCFRDRYGI